MAQSQYKVLCLIFSLPVIFFSSNCFAQKIKAVGTGQTTGHVATLFVTNNSKELLVLKLGPFLIPSTKKFQGYGVPDIYQLNISPDSTLKIPLRGFCTNPFIPPTGAGEDLPPFSQWVKTSDLPSLTPEMVLTPQNGFFRNAQGTQSGTFISTYPGTDTPFHYTIDIDKHPESAATFIIDLIHAVESTYERLEIEGQISTPYAQDPLRQKEAVIQQVIWYVLGILTGNDYDREDFAENVIRQYETDTQTNLDTAAPEIREQLDEGINNFWDTFTLVGVEAKVLKTKSE